MNKSASTSNHHPPPRHPPKPSASTSKSSGLRRGSAEVPPAAGAALLAAVNADSRARALAAKARAQQQQQQQPSASMTRSGSGGASFEPRSVVLGFDTSVFEGRPQVGSIAPPPTPAQPKSKELASSPPSAMKVTQNGTNAATGEKKKKLFFISSPNSDDSDDESATNRSTRHSTTQQQKQPTPSKQQQTTQPPAAASTTAAGEEDDDDEWDDDESDEDELSGSSGWGSDYSTEEDSPSQPSTSRLAGAQTPQPPAPLFARVPSQPELKPRGPGLLSQLFHPELLVDERRQNHSSSALMRGHKSMVAMPTTSRSTGNMPPPVRNKSFLRPKPDDVELESSSEEDGNNSGGEFEDESPESQHDSLAAALARHQRVQQLDPTVALPQTPRTTRRAMLATELSESLRRNLLWERQTRNRPVGRPAAPQLPPSHAPQGRQQQQQGTAPNLVPPPAFDPRTVDGGLMAPHPSPATRNSSPIEPLVRRHTTGTGMYLLAQQNGLMGMTKNSPIDRTPNPLLRPSPPTVSKPKSLYQPGDESASDSSADEDERDRPRGYASPAEGVRVW